VGGVDMLLCRVDLLVVGRTKWATYGKTAENGHGDPWTDYGEGLNGGSDCRWVGDPI
jgi:hypothetical protein